MSLTLRILGTLAVVGMLAASTGPANAAQIQLNGNKPYLYVAVQGSSTADGTAVIAYSCSGGPNDQWNWVEGQLQGLGTANGKSMCLDVKGPRRTPLEPWWTCGPATAG
ncbi:MAG TPA: RICIN domain-containing protein [Bryobacteraceae bacterium]|jgi:hypothetical protein|nr:RICIN domain-containing protein [Bryobacteraceae bacterium]